VSEGGGCKRFKIVSNGGFGISGIQIWNSSARELFIQLGLKQNILYDTYLIR